MSHILDTSEASEEDNDDDEEEEKEDGDDGYYDILPDFPESSNVPSRT